MRRFPFQSDAREPLPRGLRLSSGRTRIDPFRTQRTGGPSLGGFSDRSSGCSCGMYGPKRQAAHCPNSTRSALGRHPSRGATGPMSPSLRGRSHMVRQYVSRPACQGRRVMEQLCFVECGGSMCGLGLTPHGSKRGSSKDFFMLI